MRLIIDYNDGEGTEGMLQGIRDNLLKKIDVEMGSLSITNVEIIKTDDEEEEEEEPEREIEPNFDYNDLD